MVIKGKALKKTATNDRSAPKVGRTTNKPNVGSLRAGSHAGPHSGSHAGPHSGSHGGSHASPHSGSHAGPSSSSFNAGLGGLFAQGMPKLKKTNLGVATGRQAGK